jgi:hypothetical protein
LSLLEKASEQRVGKMVQVLIVLGMHRSGTSAIAGALTKLGASAPKTLYPGDNVNERGYFESASIMAFHDELLASAATNWRDWRSFDPAWYGSPVCKEYSCRAKALFEEEFGEATLATFKDPRVCRFLPFWINIFGAMNIAPHIIIPLRCPMEVSKSLKFRNEISVPEGILVWLRHVLDAEAASRTLPRSIVKFREFISDPRGVSEKISHEVGITWPRPADEAERDVKSFLSAELLHNTVSDSELMSSPDVHDWARDAYYNLSALVRNPRSSEDMKSLDRIRARLDEAAALFGPLLSDADLRTRDLSAQAGSLQVQLDTWRHKYKALDARRSAELSALEGRLESVMAMNTDLAKRLDARSSEVERLRKGYQVAMKRGLEVTQKAAEFRAQIKEEGRRHDASVRCLHEKLFAAEAAVASLERQSRTATLPFGSLTLALQKRRLARELVKSDLFDSTWYLRQYAEVRLSRLVPAQHYLQHGFRIGYFPNPFFDTRWYLQRYEDVRRAGINPLVHYLRHGHREGRDPGPRFHTSWYIEANPDVRESGINPLAHFLRFGQAEGRMPTRPFR